MGSNARRRKFDPTKITTDNIPHAVIFHGDDGIGISARLDRMSQVLQESGVLVESFDSADAASEYMQSGGMFGSQPNAIINDASDLLTSRSDKTRANFSNALANCGDGSHIIASVGKQNDSKRMELLRSFCSENKIMLREVSIPRGDLKGWASELAELRGIELREDTLGMLVTTLDSPDDIDHAISSIGRGLSEMTSDQLAETMGYLGKPQFSNLLFAYQSENLQLLKRQADLYVKTGGLRLFISNLSSCALRTAVLANDSTPNITSYRRYIESHIRNGFCRETPRDRDRLLERAPASTWSRRYQIIVARYEDMFQDTFELDNFLVEIMI